MQRRIVLMDEPSADPDENSSCGIECGRQYAKVLTTKLFELMGWNPASCSILVWMKVQTMPGVYHYVEVKNDENLAASFNLVLTGVKCLFWKFLWREEAAGTEGGGGYNGKQCSW